MGVLDDAIREHLELKRSRGATDDEIARDEAEALGPARRERAADPNAGFVEALSEEAETAAPPPPPPPAAEEAAMAVEAPDDELALPSLEEPPEPAEPPVEAEPPTAVEPDAGFEPPPPIDEPAAALDEPTAVHQPPPAAPEPVLDDDLEPDEVPADERLSEPPPPALSDETAEYDVLADVPPGAGVEDELDEDAPLAPPPPAPLADDPSAPPEPARPPVADAEPGGDEDLLEETPDFLQETPEHDRLWFEQKPPRDFDFDD